MAVAFTLLFFASPLFENSLLFEELLALSLDSLLALYAWHSRHHVAHITTLRARNGW